MIDEVKAIESQLRLARLSADDWQKRLKPARKALTEAEGQQLELAAQRRKAVAQIAAIEAGDVDADDLT